MRAHLINRDAISISGETTEQWLQDLITLDMKLLIDRGWHGAALLTPQGKILFDFLIRKQSDAGFTIDISADQTAGLLQRLTLYRLRAKIDIGAAEPIEIDITDNAGNGAIRDSRFQTLVFRATMPASDGAENRAEYDAARITEGIAEGGIDYALSDVFPHDVNLDQIGSLSFRKGCYVGQEVISRMQHHGTARRRLVIVQSEKATLKTGADIVAMMAPDREISIGTIGTSVEGQALAICRLDRISDAIKQSAMITVAGETVSITLPENVTYSLDALDKISD